MSPNIKTNLIDDDRTDNRVDPPLLTLRNEFTECVEAVIADDILGCFLKPSLVDVDLQWAICAPLKVQNTDEVHENDMEKILILLIVFELCEIASVSKVLCVLLWVRGVLQNTEHYGWVLLDLVVSIVYAPKNKLALDDYTAHSRAVATIIHRGFATEKGASCEVTLSGFALVVLLLNSDKYSSHEVI
ncbi:hypothetical protein DKX38_021421 [Salix brachista]|uniref:Uncharacterized protein n=1 Tax=Salix brachista TaxID=2182728 RepID=A0A5N5KA94_9ROSI|nr:hypothetical protein DKX38_021421 [Salix brachista]